MKRAPLWTLTAVLLTGSLAACGNSPSAIANIAERQAVLNVALTLPDLPDECRKTLSHGVSSGQRLDSALERVAGRLAAQNQRVLGCAQWYDALQVSRAPGELK